MSFFGTLEKYKQPDSIMPSRVEASRPKRARSDTRTPLAKSTLIGNYRFEKLIGHGSFSLVYRAIDIRSEQGVIIKEYFPKLFAERLSNHSIVPVDGSKLMAFDVGYQQFNREMRALQGLKHPNVPKVCDFLLANQTAYLVSANWAGRDLKWFITSNRGLLDQGLIYKVFLPILSALNFLHITHLLHLDIKPANILLQPNGESLLLDFGAAQELNIAERIQQKQIVTHGFAPPEQYDKNALLGPWTDIYAVAATLYYCIVGKSPAKSMHRSSASRLSLSRYGDRYSAGFISAINRALRLDPYDRYDSIDDFSAVLLEGSIWKSLLEFEEEVMVYNRFVLPKIYLQQNGLSAAA